MLGSKSSNKKIKQPDQPFTMKEKVDWSSTEGYETMKEVNNFLKWPSVWVNRKDKASREINTRPAKSEQKSKTESRADSAISKPMVVDKPSSKVVSSKPAKGSDPNIKNTTLPPLSKPTKQQHLLEVCTSKVSQKQNHFWQFLVRGWSARKLKKLNQERSRQIKRLSVSGTLSGSQIDSATFQTKEGQRHQVNKVISNKAVVQPSSGKGQPSQSANLPKIEKNQEDFKNKDQDKQKEKEQELAAALVGFQSELKPVKFNKKNQFLGNRYADLGAIIDETRPRLAAYGLAIIQNAVSEGDQIGIETLILHKSGEYMGNSFTMPTGPEKGKSAAQVAGSMITYARRYALAACLLYTSPSPRDS